MSVFIKDKEYGNVERTSADVIRLDDGFPSHILEDHPTFEMFMKNYMAFMNQKGFSTELILNLHKSRDIDEADSQFIDLLIEEIGTGLPKKLQTNRLTFYKHIVDFYKTKGSIDSIKTFFRVFYNSDVDIYYPKEQIFSLSSGNWDKNLRVPSYTGNTFNGFEFGGYLDNKGFLSDNIKITDSYYYQPYSYVLQTQQNISTWRYIYNKTIHPAGFIFFGEVEIFIILLKDDNNSFRIPNTQPGYVRPVELPQNIYVILKDLNMNLKDVEVYVTKKIDTETSLSVDKLRRENIDHWLYYDHGTIDQFLNTPINEFSTKWDKQVSVFIESELIENIYNFEYLLTG